MPPPDPVVIVAVASFAAILLFGLVVGCGSLAVRWLSLPADPPDETAFEPPAPAPVPAGDPAAARARAAAWQARAAFGARARAVLTAARSLQELAEWIAVCEEGRAASARAQAASALAAAERARAALAAGDDTALAAAELDVATATSALQAAAVGLPDWQAGERRKLLMLTAALVVSLILAAGAMWLR